jgi:hypothetical protein
MRAAPGRVSPSDDHEFLSVERRAGGALLCNERGVRYSTRPCCGMCTMASIWAKVGRILYSIGRDDMHEMYPEDRHLSTENFIRNAFKVTSLWRAAFWRKNARLFTFRRERMCPRISSSIAGYPSTGSFAHKPEVPTSIEWPSGSRK